MPIKQITIFLENKLCRLAEVARILKNENINLHGFSTTEAKDYGILRIVVSDHDKAIEVLNTAGFVTHVSDVLCVVVEDKPGELLQILDSLTEKKINIDYIYIIAGTRVILSVQDVGKAEEVLKEEGFRICQ
jgi:hypothetical protein